jgi:hypothetical protein
MEVPMRALTLIQPWAWAIAHAGKVIENRTWAPPHSLLGQRIAIHAGKKRERGLFLPDGSTPPLFLDQSAVVAVGTLVGYVCDDGNGRVEANHFGAEIMRAACASPWYQGPVGWIVVNRIALPTPVPCRGAQGLWTLPPDVEAAVMRQLGEVKP